MKKPFGPRRPPHLYLDNQIYFITCRTRDGMWFLRPDKYRRILLEVMRETFGTLKCAIPSFGDTTLVVSEHTEVCSPTPSRNADFSPQMQTKVCTPRDLGGGTFLSAEARRAKAEVPPAGAQLIAFAILPNHYHLMFKLQKGINLPKIMQKINGKSARSINEEDVSLRKIWTGYFDKCLRTKNDFYTHLNYIHQNPIKHDICKNFEELAKYPFCSYRNYLKLKGKEWLDDCFRQYPVVDFATFRDEF